MKNKTMHMIGFNVQYRGSIGFKIPSSAVACPFFLSFLLLCIFCFLSLLALDGMSASSHVWVDPTATPIPTSLPIQQEWIGHDLEPDCWDGDQWVGDPGQADDNTDRDAASKQLADMLLDKYHSGRWFATDICQLCWYAKQGGMTGAVADLAKRPGLHTSHYNRHIEKVLGYSGSNEQYQWLDIPCSDVADGSRTSYRIPVISPTEVLDKELSERPGLKDILAENVQQNKLPPIYTLSTLSPKIRGLRHNLSLCM